MKRSITLAAALLALFTMPVCKGALADESFPFTFSVSDNGNPGSGLYDFQWALFDAAEGGAQIGQTLTGEDLQVNFGRIEVRLNFGPVEIYANNLWIEFRKRPYTSTGDYSVEGRFPVMLATRALYAHKAGSLANNSITSLQLAPGAVNSTNIAPGAITAEHFQNNSISSSKLIDGPGSGVDADLLDGFTSAAFWMRSGNAGTVPGTHFLGTTDSQPLEFRVKNSRAFRIEPTTGAPNLVSTDTKTVSGVLGATVSGGLGHETAGSYSVIGGGIANAVKASAVGSVISGGGANIIAESSVYSSINGGNANNTGTNTLYSTISGGRQNTLKHNVSHSTISGGAQNSIENAANYSTISGGRLNVVQQNALYATISGGYQNTNSGTYSTISGGNQNAVAYTATYATLSGGSLNVISPFAEYAAILGGQSNLIGTNADWSVVIGGRSSSATAPYSSALGRRAKANHAGSIVLADSTDADFVSTAANQLSIRAAGGVRINANGGRGGLQVQDLAGQQAVSVGEYFKDNATIAWAHMSEQGTSQRFGMSVVRESPGTYLCTLTSQPNDAISVTATPSVSAAPTTAALARLASVQPINKQQFRVYITTGAFVPTDNGFSVIVTGR